MIRDITIGRYYDSESVIHRMDPRTKLMGVLVYIISLFLVKNVCWYIGCLIVMLVLYKAAGVPFWIFVERASGNPAFALFLHSCSVCCTRRGIQSYRSGYLR